MIAMKQRIRQNTKRPMEERFWAKVIKGNGCWLWIGARNRSGYGVFGVEYRNVLAHRMRYMLLVGPIPDGMFVLHHCDNPPCVTSTLDVERLVDGLVGD